MAFKLTKQQIARLELFEADLTRLRGLITAEYVALETSMKQLAALYNTHVQAYNQQVKTFERFADDIAQDHREDYDERSESWQAGDAGLAAEDFVATWESVAIDEIDEVELLMPDAPDFRKLATALKDLPHES